MSTELFILIVAYLGVFAAAVSGVMEAHRKDMDVVGATTVAFITALGGGTLRDLLLGRTPVFWVQEQGFAYATLITAVVTFYSSRLLTFSSRSILVPDALGLGVFSVLGVNYGLQSGVSDFVAVLMGITTGIFGGILRDVICNEIPSVFARSAQLYATCSLVGSVVYLGCIHLHTGQSVATLAGVAVTVLLRLTAVRFNIHLPDPPRRRHHKISHKP